MTHTEVQANVTKTATFTGAALSVASLNTNWTLKLQVSSLGAGQSARFEFDDSTNDFTSSLAGPCFDFLGEIDAAQDKVKSIKFQDFPDFAIGVSGGQVKLKLSKLTGGSVTYHAWIEG